MHSRISLAPPPSETDIEKAHDKWADPAMPENFQLLLPHTQQLLRIARSGKYGTKRKTAPDVEPDGDEFNPREEEGLPDEILAKPTLHEEKGFVARKWRQVPESALVPEHLHWEFLAKRRKGLPNYYHGDVTEISTAGIPQIAKRKTRVQRVLDPATGESVIYEVLALEGQVLDNELPADSQMPAIQLEPGTTVEGLGTADEEGIISLVPANASAPSRRNRPPPKKKGGPGRGKKRVTFTNPDGSTYTTIVPNATKIVPQPGQTVKHVAKGEDAGKDVSMEEAARQTNEGGDGDENDEGDDDEDEEEGDDEDDDGDDREEGQIQEEDAEVNVVPAKIEDSAEPAIVEPAPTEAMIVEPQIAEPAPAVSTPTISLSAPIDVPETTARSPLNPDADEEMRDVEETVEANVLSESRPESQAEPRPEELQPEPEASRHSSVKPEAQDENPDKASTNEATNAEPVEAVAPRDATPQDAVGEAAPRVETQSEEAVPAAEVEQVQVEAEDTLQAIESAANVQTPVIASEVTESAAEPLPEFSEPVTAVAEEPPLKTFDDGEEDLLGSLERSLEG